MAKQKIEIELGWIVYNNDYVRRAGNKLVRVRHSQRPWIARYTGDPGRVSRHFKSHANAMRYINQYLPYVSTVVMKEEGVRE